MLNFIEKHLDAGWSECCLAQIYRNKYICESNLLGGIFIFNAKEQPNLIRKSWSKLSITLRNNNAAIRYYVARIYWYKSVEVFPLCQCHQIYTNLIVFYQPVSDINHIFLQNDKWDFPLANLSFVHHQIENVSMY